MTETLTPVGLPAPTTDLDRARHDLDRTGCCIVAGVLAPDELAAIRTRLEEQAAAEEDAGLAYHDGGGANQRVWMLPNKGEEFWRLALHPTSTALVGHLLGEAFLLSSMTANIAGPGGAEMGLHRDQWWAPMPVDPEGEPRRVGSISRDPSSNTAPSGFVAPCATANVMWMLCDFTEENGATRLVPGSHRWPEQPRPGVGTAAGVGTAGSILVFDGRVWHGTGANTTDDDLRHGILTYFCGPQYRPQENYFVGARPELLEKAPQELLDLMGYQTWQGYGRVETPLELRVRPGEAGLPRMSSNSRPRT